MGRTRLDRRRAPRGFSSANTVVWLPLLLMMGWWALENALLFRWAYRAQATADAAALAAAARYRDGREAASEDAVAAAGSALGPAGPITIDVGDGRSGGEDLEFGTWDEETREFTGDPEDGGEAVRVTVRFAPGHPNGAPAMILGRLFGAGPVAMTRRSTAVYVPPRHETSVLATAAEGAGVSMRGSARLSCRGGVSLATSSADAAQLATGTQASIAVLRVAGAVDDASEPQVDGAIEEGASVPDDPFTSLAMPASGAADAKDILLDRTGTTFIAPGTHVGIDSDAGIIVLQPGLHRFAGPIVLGGSAHLQLAAATVQLDPGSGIALSGSASIAGTPAATVPGWEGFAIVARGMPTLSIGESASIDVEGMCYAPQADAEVSGGATLRAASTILRSLTLVEGASAEFDGEIEALETDPVPGRARLVR